VMKIPIELVEQAVRLMERYQLQELSLELDDFSLHLERAEPSAELPAVAVATPKPTTPEIEPDTTPFYPVEAPMTGMFYRGPSPNEPPYVEEGDVVHEGQTIGLIEAMKVFNEVPSPVSGTVRRILAQNATLVQQGDVLMLIELPE
jgi:acetyl-CoA carboxylase biotin carboxyl carrier protein